MLQLVEQLASEENGQHYDLSDLIVPLRGKIYPNHNPVKIVGFASQSNFIQIADTIRARLLEITIEIAKKIPGAEGVELSSITQEPEVTKQIFHQTIYGNMTNVQSSGADAKIKLTIERNNRESLKNGLSTLGLSEKDLSELVKLISEQKPEKHKDSGLNPGIRKWLADRITSGFDAGIKGGVSTLTRIIEEATKQFWGY